jgi:glycosyltransferase involved in cell wall biosynthesis
MSKISVIIPTYNLGQYLPKAIDSVLSQTYQDFEVVVVDDGSTDATAQVVKEYCVRYPDKIRYFYQENSGVSAARNVGIEHAKGEFLKFLDSDDFIYPQQLELQMESLVREDADISFTNYERIYLNGFKAVIKLRKSDYGLISLINGKFGPIHAFLVRKDAVIKAGGFDEDLNIKEDDDLWLRILISGAKVVTVDYMGCCYCIREGSQSSDNEKMFVSNCYVSEKTNHLLQPKLKTSSEALLDSLLWRNEIIIHKCFARKCEVKRLLPETLSTSHYILYSQKKGLKKILLSLFGVNLYLYSQYLLNYLAKERYKEKLTINSEIGWRICNENN